ncbi:DUF4402 domain-containing protein [Massilia violaceinigra]|uniref:DUF4402 domain-containing protein n=1 Tax=Massilia violaceinigra TaxID=2045208 RepID=A0ABY4A4N2_9BURK|nr:DUF4402 domain-containing protein [Massilia violaceinigra]UOD28634.1 DUF4402 domain-containing protein [Massilia violaceinigra]
MNTTIQHKRTLAVFAFIAAGLGLGVPAHAAQATATAGGTVVTPIAITPTIQLAFGKFAAAVGGTITVSTSGARTVSGVVGMSGPATSAARFDITGEPGSTYTITHSGSTVLTNTGGAGETMALAKFSDLTGADGTSGEATSGTLSAGGTQSLYVGGTLTVAANQVPGVYAGNVIATVEYN